MERAHTKILMRLKVAIYYNGQKNYLAGGDRFRIDRFDGEALSQSCAVFSTNPTMRHLTHFCVTSVHIDQRRVVLDEGNSCAAGGLESAEIRHFRAHGDRRRRVARRGSTVNLASISHYLKRLSKK
jgi:hypothetical protein